MVTFPLMIIDFLIFLFLYLFIYIYIYIFLHLDMYWIYSNLARSALNKSCIHPCNVDK